MSEQKGRDFVLQHEDGASPASYTTIAGMTLTSMSINNSPVDITDKDSAGVQELLEDAGVQSMSVQADGRYVHGAPHDNLEDMAHNRTKENFKLVWGNSDTYEASFVVDTYNRGGPHDAEETFSVSLIRSGAGSLTRA